MPRLNRISYADAQPGTRRASSQPSSSRSIGAHSAGIDGQARRMMGSSALAQVLQVGDQRRHAGDEAAAVPAMARISRMASMVTSAEVALSKKTAIIVASRRS